MNLTIVASAPICRVFATTAGQALKTPRIRVVSRLMQQADAQE
jgi:hypothetical protein